MWKHEEKVEEVRSKLKQKKAQSDLILKMKKDIEENISIFKKVLTEKDEAISEQK